MSKPKHYMRNRGFWVGRGYRLQDFSDPQKRDWNYADYLTNTIEEIKLRGPSKHLAKLRKYLDRTT